MADYEPLAALVNGWNGKIQTAIQHKQREFGDTAQQCMAFFSGSVDFMWSKQYKQKYLRGPIAPTFEVCLMKGFELVALFGPMLYHRNPIRRVQPYKAIEFGPDAFDPGMLLYQAQDLQQKAQEAQQQFQQAQQAGQVTPQMFQQVQAITMQAQQAMAQAQQIQQQFQQAQAVHAREFSQKKLAAQLIEHYLNYTPKEQPDGGLKLAAEDAITEALVKGRGLLWPQKYCMPGSDRILTGSFYDTVDNLLYDPDARSFNFGEGRYLIRRHVNATWEVERIFKLPNGILKAKKGDIKGTQGFYESAEAQGGTMYAAPNALERQRGSSFDLIVWYEIWSIGGVGTRLTGTSKVLQEAFDDVVGDFAYLAISPGVPWPLNMPRERFIDATDEEVKQAFQWPTPFWLDQRWPCINLDFYHKPNSAWAHAPLASGLGELTMMNILASSMLNRAWNSSRLLMGVLESAKSYVQTELENGKDIVVMGIKEIHQDLNKVISNFSPPEAGQFCLNMLEWTSSTFDKRSGLSELLYGMQESQDRSATASSGKQQATQIRPDHMANKVECWMTEVARAEKLTAYWSGVNGQDVKPLVGSVGAFLWDRFVTQADPEMIVREMDATVESGSARKPNKDRDTANMNQMFQALTPVMTNYAAATSDTRPFNELVKEMGDVLEQDLSGLQLGTWAPPPPPPGTPNPQEMEMQIEQARAQTEMQTAQQKAQLDAQGQQMDMAGKQQDMLMKAAEHREDLRFSKAQHRQELRQDQETAKQDLKQQRDKAAQDRKLAEMKARMQRLQGNNRPKPQGASR